MELQKKWIYAAYALFVAAVSVFLLSRAADSRAYSLDLKDFTYDGGEYRDGGIYIDPSFGPLDQFADSSNVFLHAGQYLLTVSYEADFDQSILIQAGSYATISELLYAEDSSYTTSFALPSGTDKLRVKFNYSGEGTFRARDVTLSSPEPIHRDAVYYLIVFLLANLLAVAAFALYRRGKLSREKILVFSILTFAGLLVSLPLLSRSLLMGVDVRGHLLRIEGIRAGLLERQLPVIVKPNYLNQFGELGCLYPYTFLYFPAVLRILWVSPVAAYKTLIVAINLASCYSAYYCAKQLVSKTSPALFAALLYCLAPYRLYVMYRGGQAGGMGLAMIFVPFILAGLYHLPLEDERKWFLLVIGFTGVIESHVLTTVLCVITTVVFLAVFFKKLMQKKRLVSLIKAAVVSLFINLFTIVPFLRYFFTDLNYEKLVFNYYENTYTLAFIVANPLSLFILTPLAFMIYYLVKNRGEERDSVYSFTACLAGITVFGYLLTIRYFPWGLFQNFGATDSLMSFIQFPERLFEILAPAAALALGLLITRETFQKRNSQYLMTGIMAVICLSGMIVQFQKYYTSEPLFFQNLVGDINSFTMIDYTPRGVTREDAVSSYARVSDDSSVIPSHYEKDGTRAIFRYTCAGEGEYVEFPLFYYEGYTAINLDGQPLPVCLGDNGRVRVYLESGPGEKGLTLYFSVFWYFKLCLLISFGSVLLFGFWLYNNRAVLKPDGRSRRRPAEGDPDGRPGRRVGDGGRRKASQTEAARNGSDGGRRETAQTEAGVKRLRVPPRRRRPEGSAPPYPSGPRCPLPAPRPPS